MTSGGCFFVKAKKKKEKINLKAFSVLKGIES